MAKARKVSEVFDTVFSESDRHAVHDAIVIFEDEPIRERAALPTSETEAWLSDPERRAQFATANQAAQSQFFDRHLTEVDARSKRTDAATLQWSPIGNGALPVAYCEVTEATLGEIAKHDEVVAILPNQAIEIIEPTARGSEPVSTAEVRQSTTWGLEWIGAPKLWATTKGGGETVAVLDTGVHGDHPAFGDRVQQVVVFDPLGRRITVSPSFDAGEHGTHVCGTVAGGTTDEGVAIGVAPQASLVVGGVLVGRGTLRALVEAIDWAIGVGARTLNMSLGFSYYEPLFSILLDRLIEAADIVPVVAIGNENHGNSSSPGNAPPALGVGAAQQSPRGRLTIAPFSSGASLELPDDPKHKRAVKPDVVAPGRDVYSAVPPSKVDGRDVQYQYMSGTSMATPHVAGLCALLRAAKPDARASDIIAALKDTAWRPRGSRRVLDNRWGHGLVQGDQAFEVL